MAKHGYLVLVCVVISSILCSVLPSKVGFVYTVGDYSGWRTNVDYKAWLVGKKFYVGDGLVFASTKEHHTVQEVHESDYNTCNITNPIRSYDEQVIGIPFTESGTRCFICGVPEHCNYGMKLAVTINSPGGFWPPPVKPIPLPPPGFLPPLSTPPGFLPPLSPPPRVLSPLPSLQPPPVSCHHRNAGFSLSSSPLLFALVLISSHYLC